jgi:hypothetical protein
MKKAISVAMTLVWMAVVGGGAWADVPLKQTTPLTKAQFQEKIKARHSKKTKNGREISGTAKKGAPQVSSPVVKKNN